MGRPAKRSGIKALLVFGVIAGQSLSTALAERDNLTLPDAVSGTVELALRDDAKGDPARMLQVFVGKSTVCCAGKSPMAGRTRVDGRVASFAPAFDFVQGQSHTFLTRAGTQDTRTEFTIQPEGQFNRPEVVAIHPSGADIPENTLRFYIHFSTPMQPHRATELIKLIGADGVADTAAFMTFKQELWSADRKRLTLLMDPGRIKRGVAQNVRLGPALREGQSYALVIEGGWPSANGPTTAPRFERPFTMSAPLRTRPAPDLWQIAAPRTTTREPLVIAFDRPFDHAFAKTAITVLDQTGQTISGSVTSENSEIRWRFEPHTAWPAHIVQILIDRRLEDVAGNSFTELLDHALGAKAGVKNHVAITLAPQPADAQR